MTYGALRRVLCAAAAVALFSGAAQAQGVPGAETGTAFPGRVEEQLQAPGGALRVAPRIEVREIEIQGAPPGSDQISFRLDTLRIEGVTVYGESELASVYSSRLGSTITLAELYGIAAELTRKYRNDGYILTQIVVPPQTIEGGTARLQVIEGFIGDVEVRGSEPESAMSLVRSLAARVKAGEGAVNVRQIERALLLINDLPGIEARGVLSPSPDQAGAADLLVIVERNPYDALVSVDNFGSRYLGPVQLTAAGSLNNPLGRNERITAQIVAAPSGDGIDTEMTFFGFSYEQPIFRNGMTVEVFASHTKTDPGFDLEQFDVRGRARALGLRIKHPVVRTRSFNLTTRGTFDLRNVHSSNNIAPALEDSIRALRLGGRAEFLDSLLGVAFNTVDLELARGIDFFGSSQDKDVNVSRPNADPDFFKMEAEIQRLQRLTPEMNLLLGLTGQWSSDGLLSSEEFGVGGLNYGRGYDPSEIIGDDGIAGKIEVQWNEPYELALLETYQLFGFYDAGRIWNTDTNINAQKSDTITSSGLGIRADFTDTTTAGLMIAFPLNRDVQTQRDHDPRIYANVNKRF